MDIPSKTNALEAVPLASLTKGARARVSAVLATDASVVGDVTGSTIGRRLVELGFVAGEPLEVLATVQPGGDPMAVRIGTTIFALRKREASAVLVVPESTPSAKPGSAPVPA